MKKKSILLAILFVGVLFLFTGCGKKTVATDADFKKVFQESGYVIYDATSQFAATGVVESATIAQNSNGVQVEFYVLDDEASAISMFNTNKTTFEGFKGNSATESSATMANYSTYTLTSSGYYMHLCRVENTMIYLRVSDTYKKDVQEVVKKIGY